MTKEQSNVKEFMQAAGQLCPDKPMIPDYKMRSLRIRLLLEEVFELAEASAVSIGLDRPVQPYERLKFEDLKFVNGDGEPDLCEMIDALADIDYVNLGAAVAYGVDLSPFQEEVQRSNMSKFIDGHRDEVTGKWIKGPSYSPANLKPILDSQQA